MKQQGWLVGALVAAAGGWWLGRMAPVRQARIARQHPQGVEIVLDYGIGQPPHAIIVDLFGEGVAGSATCTGNDGSVLVPLAGAPAGPVQLVVTSRRRVFAWLQHQRAEFRV